MVILSSNNVIQICKIYLWSIFAVLSMHRCASRWKNLGEFPFHKLNVTGLEFSPDGKKLLSVSRDRTWAIWNIMKDGLPGSETISMCVKQSENYHTRAIWVGTWSPCGKYFVTGGRDKKMAIWIEDSEYENIPSHSTRSLKCLNVLCSEMFSELENMLHMQQKCFNAQ